MAPNGPVTTPAPWGQGASFGINWDAITRYDGFIREAADPVGWPIGRVRGHIVIESQGVADAVQRNNGNGSSYGLMQVVPYGVGWEGWHGLVKEKAGLPRHAPPQKVRQALARPRTNIAVGVAILETFYAAHGTLDAASSAFFTGTPNWARDDPISGVTGRRYQAALNGLLAEQAAMELGDEAALAETQVKVGDPLQIIFGGQPAPITYGFREPGPPSYDSGVGHGTSSPNEHPGIDVDVPYSTPLYAPADGEVICVGGNGGAMWGQPCGGFRDTGDLGPSADDLGVGNITVLLDSGHKITFGHCRLAFRNPGDRVQAGQMLGTSGGMFGAHVHIEVARCEPALTGDTASCYWFYDPVTELSNAISPRIAFAPRVPLPQPHELGVSIPVTATRDGVPVLQRASADAAYSDVPLEQGEIFAGVMLVLGADRSWYWVSPRGSYIPVAGTAATQGPTVPVS